jgi:hypothetical protein
MKCVKAVTVALLFLVLGAGVQAYARQDQQDEKQTKPEKQGKPDQSRTCTRSLHSRF